jgi:hypothetical protein
LVTDYLFLEQLIVDKLKADVPGLKGVFSSPDLATISGQQQITPAAHVIYLGDETGSGPGDQGTMGQVQTITQLWAVVIAVYFADAHNTGAGTRRLAGPLITSMLDAMSGWTPQDTVVPLTRGRPINAHYANGYGYYPFVFRAKFVYKPSKKP